MKIIEVGKNDTLVLKLLDNDKISKQERSALANNLNNITSMRVLIIDRDCELTILKQKEEEDGREGTRY